MEANEKSGQLIECVNPEHWKLGSIHYKQDSCVAAWEYVVTKFAEQIGQALAINLDREITRADSDESWQASEALLKR
jgi:hypothetical protein